jgi:hypothetical protein
MKKSTTNGSRRIRRTTKLRNRVPNAVFGGTDEADFATDRCLRLRNGISRNPEAVFVRFSPVCVYCRPE